MSTTDAFRINGVVDTTRSVLDNLNTLCNASGCWLSFDITTGLWSVIINKTGDSVKPFDDSNIIGNINVSFTGINELYNKVSIDFPHKDLRDQRDYIDLSIAEGDRLPNELDNTLSMSFDIINDPVQAQYIAQIELKQSRQNTVIEFRTDFSSLGLRAGDIIDITSEQYGYIAKKFRIIKISEEDTDTGSLELSIQAIVYDPSIYDASGLVREERTKKTGIIPKGMNSALTNSDNLSNMNNLNNGLSNNAAAPLALLLANTLLKALANGMNSGTNPTNVKDFIDALKNNGVNSDPATTINYFENNYHGSDNIKSLLNGNPRDDFDTNKKVLITTGPLTITGYYKVTAFFNYSSASQGFGTKISAIRIRDTSDNVIPMSTVSPIVASGISSLTHGVADSTEDHCLHYLFKGEKGKSYKLEINSGYINNGTAVTVNTPIASDLNAYVEGFIQYFNARGSQLGTGGTGGGGGDTGGGGEPLEFTIGPQYISGLPGGGYIEDNYLLDVYEKFETYVVGATSYKLYRNGVYIDTFTVSSTIFPCGIVHNTSALINADYKVTYKIVPVSEIECVKFISDAGCSFYGPANFGSRMIDIISWGGWTNRLDYNYSHDPIGGLLGGPPEDGTVPVPHLVETIPAIEPKGTIWFNLFKDNNFIDNHADKLASYNTSHVVNMKGIFNNAWRQSGDLDLTNWDVSNITSLTSAFSFITFGPVTINVSGWDTSKVTDMSYTFRSEDLTITGLNTWNTSNVTNMSHMFENYSNGWVPVIVANSISSWNTSKVTNMDYMFSHNREFNQDLSQWCVSLIPSEPLWFADDTDAWILPKPIWGTCPT